jgi:hypothetical protein
MRMHRPRLTYANVMATLAFFLALGAGAYAAFKLPKNSVKSSNIVNGQVKSRDLAPAGAFKSAGLATINSPNDCGFVGQPQNQWIEFTPAIYGQVGYYRDTEGYVHLQGWAHKCQTPATGSVIFILPPGYRPAITEVQAVAPVNDEQVSVDPQGNVSGAGPGLPILSGVEFRCAPSGKNGCP